MKTNPSHYTDGLGGKYAVEYYSWSSSRANGRCADLAEAKGLAREHSTDLHQRSREPEGDRPVTNSIVGVSAYCPRCPYEHWHEIASYMGGKQVATGLGRY